MQRNKTALVMAQHLVKLEDGSTAWTPLVTTKLIAYPPDEQRGIINIPNLEGNTDFLIITGLVQNGQRVFCGPQRAAQQPENREGPWQPPVWESNGVARLRVTEEDFQGFMQALRWTRYSTPAADGESQG